MKFDCVLENISLFQLAVPSGIGVIPSQIKKPEEIQETAKEIASDIHGVDD